MSWLMVVPAINRAVTNKFRFYCHLPVDQILIVDNGDAALDWTGRYHRDPTGRNLGVGASWNLGARAVLAENIDWLIIASAAVRFGPLGGTDLIDALGLCTSPAAGVQTHEGVDCAVQTPFGWHLVALHRTTLERVGLFDENFYPGYFEDTDYLYRMGLAGLPSPRENDRNWCQANVDGAYGETAHSLADGRIRVNWVRLGAYYSIKWGGPQGHETYRHPFNDPTNSIGYWPEVK